MRFWLPLLLAATCRGFVWQGRGPRGAVWCAARRRAGTTPESSIPELVYNRPSLEEIQTPHIPDEWESYVVALSTVYSEPPEDEKDREKRLWDQEHVNMQHMLWKYAPYRLRSANNATALRNTGAGLCAWDMTLFSRDRRNIEANLFGLRGNDTDVLEKMARTSPFARAGEMETWIFKPNDAAELNWQLRADPFALVCLDKDASLELRKATRPAHLEYLKDLKTVHQGGPLFKVGDEDAGPIGSLVLFSADSIEDAMRVRDEDPYAKAGLFKQTRLYPLVIMDVNGRNIQERRSLDDRDVVREVLEDCEIAEHWDYPEKQIFYRVLREGEKPKMKEEKEEVIWQFDGQRLRRVSPTQLAAVLEGEVSYRAAVSGEDETEDGDEEEGRVLREDPDMEQLEDEAL